ncbi:sigma-70 family RNA polymerase sigma factor [bacterium]|nr:sigma-70 family RNA polymerase sigma factor [bacterium]
MENATIPKSEWLPWVVDRYQGPLIRVAFRITGNLEVAREVVQDTFLRLCRQEQRLVNGQLASWLFTVCRNRALDVLKK